MSFYMFSQWDLMGFEYLPLSNACQDRHGLITWVRESWVKSWQELASQCLLVLISTAVYRVTDGYFLNRICLESMNLLKIADQTLEDCQTIAVCVPRSGSCQGKLFCAGWLLKIFMTFQIDFPALAINIGIWMLCVVQVLCLHNQVFYARELTDEGEMVTYGNYYRLYYW